MESPQYVALVHFMYKFKYSEAVVRKAVYSIHRIVIFSCFLKLAVQKLKFSLNINGPLTL